MPDRRPSHPALIERPGPGFPLPSGPAGRSFSTRGSRRAIIEDAIAIARRDTPSRGGAILPGDVMRVLRQFDVRGINRDDVGAVLYETSETPSKTEKRP
jgi:hypothetical protein